MGLHLTILPIHLFFSIDHLPVLTVLLLYLSDGMFIVIHRVLALENKAAC